jgi:hypothetical protein
LASFLTIAIMHNIIPVINIITPINSIKKYNAIVFNSKSNFVSIVSTIVDIKVTDVIDNNNIPPINSKI